MSRILYIEDNPLNMRLVSRHLKRINVEMLEAMTGTQGIEVALSERPDIILVDVNLPDIDGLEVTRRLKQEAALKNVPMIALTANAMHGDREMCLNAGCDAYLAKPIARQELYNTLRSYMPELFAVAS